MLHYDPQHVSSSTLLILRRTNCITTASGIVTLCKQPYSMKVESGKAMTSHDKPEIHSGSTPSLQPRFGTFGLLVVPKLEGDVKGSTFCIGCRS